MFTWNFFSLFTCHLINKNYQEQHQGGIRSSFPHVRLCLNLVAAEARATSQKMICKEDSLQEAHGSANAEARRRTGVLYSSDDRHYEGDFDAENHLGKAEESKFLQRMHQQLGCGQMKVNFCVSRESFQFLCLELTPYLQRNSVVQKSLSAEKRVAITLWRLGTNINIVL